MNVSIRGSARPSTVVAENLFLDHEVDIRTLVPAKYKPRTIRDYSYTHISQGNLELREG